MLRPVTIVGYMPIDSELTGYCRFEDILPLRQCKKISLLPENPKTVITMLFPYYVGELEERNVARFACVDDYHKVAGGILESAAARLEADFPGEQFVPFVDDSPIREVFAGQVCGLGVIGRNGMLINSVYGSRVFIGEIVTTLDMPPSMCEVKSCPQCGRCVKSCPTGALAIGKPLDRNRCRAHITQKKGILDEWERSGLKAGGMVWGCDICGDACPLNADKRLTKIDAFFKNITPVITRENLDSAIADKPYSWRGRDTVLRNLAILEE